GQASETNSESSERSNGESAEGIPAENPEPETPIQSALPRATERVLDKSQLFTSAWNETRPEPQGRRADPESPLPQRLSVPPKVLGETDLPPELHIEDVAPTIENTAIRFLIDVSGSSSSWREALLRQLVR